MKNRARIRLMTDGRSVCVTVPHGEEGGVGIADAEDGTELVFHDADVLRELYHALHARFGGTPRPKSVPPPLPPALPRPFLVDPNTPVGRALRALPKRSATLAPATSR